MPDMTGDGDDVMFRTSDPVRQMRCSELDEWPVNGKMQNRQIHAVDSERTVA